MPPGPRRHGCRRRTSTTCASWLQPPANLLAGASLVVDGIWGARTQEGYDRRLDGFGITCLDPRRQVADALVLLDLVSRTALADLPFGALRSDACTSLCDVVGVDIPVACDLL